jgi:hypothetical protein
MLPGGAHAATLGTPKPVLQSDRLFCPGALARAIAHLRGTGLDRQLAAGADPAESRVLAARAAQLTATSRRARIAEGIERLARSPQRRHRRFEVVPSHAAVGMNQDRLLELAAWLRQDRPLYARGVAAVRLLLVDGRGPVYTDPYGDALARELDAAQAALAG